MRLLISFILYLLVLSTTSAQFNQNAPWMPSQESSTNASKSLGKKLTIDEISNSFNVYWKNKDPFTKGSGFKPYKRWENYWKYFANRNGELPSSKALLDAWKNKKNLSGKGVNPVSQWKPVGPFNPGTLGGSLPGTGRINTMAVDPNNPNIWYAGAPAGGIWKSMDAGTSWVNLFDDFLQIGVSGIAIDKSNSNIIYIATGDDDAGDSFSAGVFKSLDGGTSWVETTLGPSSINNWGNNRRMSEIQIDPTNSNIVWVATSFGLYKSKDSGGTWNLKQTGDITDFRLKPDDSNTVYAITSSEYYKSTDGENFNKITDILPTTSGRRVLDVTPINPNVLYILTAKSGEDDFKYQGLYKSTDSGNTFVKSLNTIDLMESNQAWFDLALAVSSTNENEIFVGCLNIWNSKNGGNTFTKLNEWYTTNEAYTHADVHTLKYINNTLFAGTDGGLYTSLDNGKSFLDKTSNMSISQFYRISVAKGDNTIIAGGTQDNAGFISNGNQWNVYTGGDGMDYEIDRSNSNLLYGFAQFGNPLYISNNAGQSVGYVDAPADSEGNAIQGNWITPLAVAPNGDVFAGFDALYKLSGNVWEKWSTNLDVPFIEDIEIDPTNSSIIYVVELFKIYRSTDGGVTFTLFSELNSSISDLSINNTDGSEIYVTTSGSVDIPLKDQQTTRAVYKISIDENGNALPEENITLNLPTDQAYFAIVHQGRHTDNPIYVATSLGVYRLDDTLTEWEDYFTGLPNTAVSDLEITLDTDIITASTYGRGVWQSKIPVQIPENDVRIVDITPSSHLVVCGTVSPEITIENNGINSITELLVTYNLNSGPDQTYNWTGNLNSGETTTVIIPELQNTIKGVNQLKVITTITNDAYTDNNEKKVHFISNDNGIDNNLYDFETEAQALISINDTDDSIVWERGVPTGNLLNTTSSGTQVYGTNLDGNHTDGAKGYLLSGCYDFSSTITPVLKFDMAFDLEINFDIVFVEYSIDEGATWSNLGNLGSKPNWYNSNRTNLNSGPDDDCQNCPGAQWTGTDTTLKTYAYDFNINASAGETDLTQEDNIVFRIVFLSDPAVNQEGVIIDNFIIEGAQDDEDDDNDGILDVDDNCQYITNAEQLDTDNDNQGDACDQDDDNDGIDDSLDNCPLTANPNQEDFDNDGIGDVCDDDIDNDGIPNTQDLCLRTTLNKVVNSNGCEVFSLPSNNFSIQSIGESCQSSNNGSITITAIENLNYTATLTSNGIDTKNLFTNTTSFDKLTAGSYTVCITIASQPNYKSCFNLTVTEPEALNVSGKVSTLKSELTLNLSGGTTYTILLNGKKYETSKNEITLPLKQKENTVLVTTDVDCQGSFKETILLSEELLVYPNPISKGNLNVFLGNDVSGEIEMSLFTIAGVQVYKKSINYNNTDSLKFNMDSFPTGIYILNIKIENRLLNYKIIKK